MKIGITMFEHSCFIENTEAAREHLRKLGYESFSKEQKNKIIYTEPSESVYCGASERIIDCFRSSVIDCRGNLPLFKALTAVRDDSDYMQWFVADCDLYFVDTKEHCLKGELFLCKELDSKNLMLLPSAKKPPFEHKATKEELIEKFKRKNDEHYR